MVFLDLAFGAKFTIIDTLTPDPDTYKKSGIILSLVLSPPRNLSRGFKFIMLRIFLFYGRLDLRTSASWRKIRDRNFLCIYF